MRMKTIGRTIISLTLFGLSLFFIGCKPEEITALATTSRLTTVNTTILSSSTTESTDVTPVTALSTHVVSAVEAELISRLEEIQPLSDDFPLASASEILNMKIYASNKTTVLLDQDVIGQTDVDANDFYFYSSVASGELIFANLAYEKNNLVYSYQVSDNYVYRDVISSDFVNDFDRDQFLLEMEALWIDPLNFLPGCGEFVKQGENWYEISLTVDELFLYDLDLATNLLGLPEPSFSLLDYDIVFSFWLEDSFVFSVYVEPYPFESLGTKAFMEMTYEITTSFPDEINRQDFSKEDNIYSLYSDPAFCEFTYFLGDEYLINIMPGVDNYIRMDLEAGFYVSEYVYVYEDISISVYDFEMNEIPFTKTFQIHEPGTYFLNFTSWYDEEKERRLSFVLLPPDDVGTPNEPIFADGLDQNGTLEPSESRFFYFFQAPAAGIAIIEASDDMNMQYLFTNCFELSFGNNIEGYQTFILDEGDDLMVGIISEYYPADYEIIVSFHPYSEEITDISLMEELTIDALSIVGVGGPDYRQNFKIVVKTEATFNMDIFCSNETSSMWAEVNLYSEDGTLIAIEDEIVCGVTLEPGIYYIHAEVFDELNYVFYFNIYSSQI